MRSPASRLADASSFFIPTPMVKALHDVLEQWTQCGHNGGLVLGGSRQGKTTAVRALSNHLTTRNDQSIPLFRLHFGRRDTESIRAVFSKIARSLGYLVRRHHTSDELQEQICVRLAEAALVNDDRKVVLIVDEAQMLSIGQFDAFSEIYNQLYDLKINFVVFFIANQDLFHPLAQTLLRNEYKYLRDRFFNNLTYFYGIRTEKELEQCLDGYDHYPVSEDQQLSASAYFCPHLYDVGWRLAHLAPVYWRQYRERYGIPLRHSAWGMNQFVRSTNLLLMDYLPLCNDPDDSSKFEACIIKSLEASGIEPALAQLFEAPLHD